MRHASPEGIRDLAAVRIQQVPYRVIPTVVFVLAAGYFSMGSMGSMVFAATAAPAASAADQMLQATNRLRIEASLPALAADERLSSAALAFASYMAQSDRYGHQADGREPAQRVRAAGYDWCMVAENIAWQYSSRGFDTDTLARRLVEGWQQSPPHRRNLLDARARQTGIATAQSPRSGKHYAVQLFASPCGAAR